MITVGKTNKFNDRGMEPPRMIPLEPHYPSFTYMFSMLQATRTHHQTSSFVILSSLGRPRNADHRLADHAGLADGTAAATEVSSPSPYTIISSSIMSGNTNCPSTQHLPRYFAKAGHVDADPKKTKKNGAGKGGWCVTQSMRYKQGIRLMSHKGVSMAKKSRTRASILPMHAAALTAAATLPA
jgi:hypothetical protein